MKKYIYIFILIVLPTNVNADNNFYFGIGTGSSKLNYNIQSDIDRLINENGVRIYVDGLDNLGYPLNINTDLNDSITRMFVGKRLTKYWDIEALAERLGLFSGGVNISGKYKSSDMKARIYESGNATAIADAISITLIGKLPVIKKIVLYNRLGLSYMTININTRVIIGYEYDDNKQKSSKYKKLQSKNYSISSVVLYAGIGLLYDISKKYSIRFEYSRYGNSINDSHIGLATIDLIYKF